MVVGTSGSGQSWEEARDKGTSVGNRHQEARGRGRLFDCPPTCSPAAAFPTTAKGGGGI